MSEVKAPHFNLIDDPWIPVVMVDGSSGDVSLRSFLYDAGSIASVVGDIPQQEAPILRLCLAVMYRSYALACGFDMTSDQMVEEWRANWESKSLDRQVIGSYLDAMHDKFDLFGACPFMQVPGLQYVSRTPDFIAKIMADVPKPEKFLFSMRSKLAPKVISFAEAARWLLFCQAYDFAGIKSPVTGNVNSKSPRVYAPKGIPGTGWLGAIGPVFVQGRTMFETLMFNWVMFDSNPGRGPYFGIVDDLPSWERASQSSEFAHFIPKGPVGLFSVPDRRIRLLANEEGDGVDGVVLCYGEVVQPVEASRFETMTTWRESTNKQKELGLSRAPLLPEKHNASRALWHGLGPLLVSAKELGQPDLRPGVIHWIEMLVEEGIDDLPTIFSLHAQGVEYGQQDSTAENSYDDRLDLSDGLAGGNAAIIGWAVDTVAHMEKGVGCLVDLARGLEVSSGSSAVSARYLKDVRERAYLELDSLMRWRLRNFSTECDAETYCISWREDARLIVESVGRDLVSSCSASRFARRGGRSIAELESHFLRSLKSVLGLEMGPRGEKS